MQNSYTRFLVLGEGRTGSNLLVQALQSHPEVICFREVFNWTHRRIDYQVPEYEHLRASDIQLRKDNPLRLLRERIFIDHGPSIRAAGFKLHYGHALGYEGLEEALANDKDLRIIHLRRRNMLRTLASFKLAEQSGVWERDERPSLRERANRLARAGMWTVTAPRNRGMIVISPDECARFFVVHQLQAQRYDDLFCDQKKLQLEYEAMVSGFPATFDSITEFLEVAAAPPAVTLQRQNRKSLRETIRNFDELKSAFAQSPQAWMFHE